MVTRRGFAILLSGVFVSCGPAPGVDVTAGQIIANPTFYVGQNLTISGKVEDLYGPRAFTIDSGMQEGDLLVIAAEPFDVIVEERAASDDKPLGSKVIVGGTVRLFVAGAIEKEVGWDLDPELEERFTNKAVIISRTATFQREGG